jgi:hypothetical protein
MLQRKTKFKQAIEGTKLGLGLNERVSNMVGNGTMPEEEG